MVTVMISIFAHTLNHLLKINSWKYNDCVEGNKVFYGSQCVLPKLLGNVFPLRFFYDFGKLLVSAAEDSRLGWLLPSFPLYPFLSDSVGMVPGLWDPVLGDLAWWMGTMEEEGSIAGSMGMNNKGWARAWAGLLILKT